MAETQEMYMEDLHRRLGTTPEDVTEVDFLVGKRGGLLVLRLESEGTTLDLKMSPKKAVTLATGILHEVQQIQMRPASLWLFDNGNIMAFDEEGAQVVPLQLGYRKTCLWVEEHGDEGIDFYFAKGFSESGETDWHSWSDEAIAGKHVRDEFHDNWLREECDE